MEEKRFKMIPLLARETLTHDLNNSRIRGISLKLDYGELRVHNKLSCRQLLTRRYKDT